VQQTSLHSLGDTVWSHNCSVQVHSSVLWPMSNSLAVLSINSAGHSIKQDRPVCIVPLGGQDRVLRCFVIHVILLFSQWEEFCFMLKGTLQDALKA